MRVYKKLFEGYKPTDADVQTFIEMAKGSPLMNKLVENQQKHLQESEVEVGALRGQTVGDAAGAGSNMQVYATLEIFSSVIRGFTRYMDDSFCKKYVTDKVIWKMPLVEYQELVHAIGPANSTNAGQFTHTEKLISYATVDLSTPESEKGGKITWTRAFLEDVTFDAQAEMAEGLGHAIASFMMAEILDELQNGTRYIANGLTTNTTTYQALMPYGSKITVSNPINWTQFLSVIAAVDQGTYSATVGTGRFKTYGPADFVLVAPDVYWALLNIIQMTNVLYEGSTDPVVSGRIKLSLGCTIVKEGLLPTGVLIALNSEKAIALVSRRQLRIEPVIFPVWNEYGFIGSVRYGCTVLFPQAIQLATP